MRYYSHLDKYVQAEFSDALLASLAPGGGLWMPETIPSFDEADLLKFGAFSFADCAAELAQHLTPPSLSHATNLC